jgi:hypothetical protein
VHHTLAKKPGFGLAFICCDSLKLQNISQGITIPVTYMSAGELLTGHFKIVKFSLSGLLGRDESCFNSRVMTT